MELKFFDELFDGHNKITELFRQGKYKEAKKILRETQNKFKNHRASIKEVKQTAKEKERTVRQ